MPVKILVVDDEPDLETLILQKFRRHIREERYEFVFARDGEDALRALEEEPAITVVLTDINMPRMDGLTLLGRIGDLNRLLRSVVISAYGDLENIRVAMNRGAFDFLTKPIDFTDLEVTLEKTVLEVDSVKRGQDARRQLDHVEQELTVAARIQQTILPQTFCEFDERSDVRLFAAMQPARQVGGDFYDYFWLDEDRIGFAVADVSGKGVPAALYMAISRTVLRATAMHSLAPGPCMAQMNRILCTDNGSGMFVTAFYGILHVPTGKVHYTNAGHNPPYWLSSTSEPKRFENLGGLVLGVLPEAEYVTGSLQLKPGDSLVLYTDGVTEAMDPNGAFFGEPRLVDELTKVKEALPVALVGALMAAVDTFAAGRSPHDDVTVLALRWG